VKYIFYSSQVGKQHRKRVTHIAQGHIDTYHIKPGDEVSYDQFESSVSGYKAQQTGKPTTQRYSCGSVFVNHAIHYVYLQLHHSTGGAEAKIAKRNFERIAKESGVQIKAYRADNGMFAKEEITSSAAAQNQILTFSGVGAHHQNGIAERYIHTLTEKAHMMLLHAMIHLSDQIITSFCTFAIQYAVQIHNATPLPCGLTPEQIVTGRKGRTKLDTFHTFGGPTFVLNPTPQNGKKILKWQPRSRQAIFIGFSKNRAQSVPCVYNPISRLTSPQFHVVFDDTFGSTTCAATNALPLNWPSLFEHARYSLFDSDVDSDFIPNLSKDFADPPDIRRPQVTFVDESEAASSEGEPHDKSHGQSHTPLEEDFDDACQDFQEEKEASPLL
jgi:hypothetical protein